MSLYYQALSQFNITDQTTAIIILVFLCASLLTIILRIVISIGYQTQMAVFHVYGKDLKSKTDAMNLKNGLIGKAAKDYIKSRDKGVASVSTSSIVNKHIARLGMLFWKFDSMSRFIKSFESGLLLIGILLAVFLDYPMFFGTLAIAVFLLIRILAAVFDYELARARLSDEIIEYLDREIGQFYTLDLNSGIHRLRLEMIEAVANQSAVLDSAIQKLGADLSGVLRLAISDMMLDKTVGEWKKVVESASGLQSNVNKSVEMLDTAVISLKSSVTGFGASIDGYSEKMNSLTELAGRQALALDYIEKNQAFLSDAFNKFELSLMEITEKLGNSLASIVDYRVQASYDTLNDTLADNISKIINSNNETLVRMQKLFDAFFEQSRGETQALLRIKEQMDMYLGSGG